MDRGSKHLNSEERGVIFAEHQRGNSHRGIGRLLGRPASTICRELARARQEDGVTARKRRGASMMNAVGAVGPSASWSRAATCTVSFMANLYICAGQLSRSRTDYGA